MNHVAPADEYSDYLPPVSHTKVNRRGIPLPEIPKVNSDEQDSIGKYNNEISEYSGKDDKN